MPENKWKQIIRKLFLDPAQNDEETSGSNRFRDTVAEANANPDEAVKIYRDAAKQRFGETAMAFAIPAIGTAAVTNPQIIAHVAVPMLSGEVLNQNAKRLGYNGYGDWAYNNLGVSKLMKNASNDAQDAVKTVLDFTNPGYLAGPGWYKAAWNGIGSEIKNAKQLITPAVDKFIKNINATRNLIKSRRIYNNLPIEILDPATKGDIDGLIYSRGTPVSVTKTKIKGHDSASPTLKLVYNGGTTQKQHFSSIGDLQDALYDEIAPGKMLSTGDIMSQIAKDSSKLSSGKRVLLITDESLSKDSYPLLHSVLLKNHQKGVGAISVVKDDGVYRMIRLNQMGQNPKSLKRIDQSIERLRTVLNDPNIPSRYSIFGKHYVPAIEFVKYKQGGILKAQDGTLLNTWQKAYNSNFGKGLRSILFGKDYDLSDEEYFQKHGYARPITGTVHLPMVPEEGPFMGIKYLTKGSFGTGARYNAGLERKLTEAASKKVLNATQKPLSAWEKFIQKPIEEQNRIVKFWNGENYSGMADLSRSEKGLAAFKRWLGKHKNGGILKAQRGTALINPNIIADTLKKIGFSLVAKRSNAAQIKSIPTIAIDVLTGRDKSFYNEDNINGSNEIDTYVWGKPYNSLFTGDASVGPDYTAYINRNYPDRKDKIKTYNTHFGDTLYIDETAKDLVERQLQENATVGGSMGRYAHAPSYIITKEEGRPYDAGGHLMKFGRDSNGNVIANMSDIYDFLPSDFEEYYSYTKNPHWARNIANEVGVPFIVRQNNIPVVFKKILPEYNTELQKRLGEFLAVFGDMYDLTIPKRLTDAQIKSIFDSSQYEDDRLEYMRNKGWLIPVRKSGGILKAQYGDVLEEDEDEDTYLEEYVDDDNVDNNEIVFNPYYGAAPTIEYVQSVPEPYIPQYNFTPYIEKEDKEPFVVAPLPEVVSEKPTENNDFSEEEISVLLNDGTKKQKQDVANKYLRQHLGLTREQAAAIIGCWSPESQFNLNSENKDEKAGLNKNVKSNQYGIGIGQWTGDRHTNYVNYIKSHGGKSDLKTQLDFAIDEITTKYQDYLNNLRSSQSLKDATAYTYAQYVAGTHRKIKSLEHLYKLVKDIENKYAALHTDMYGHTSGGFERRYKSAQDSLA